MQYAVSVPISYLLHGEKCSQVGSVGTAHDERHKGKRSESHARTEGADLKSLA